MGTTTIAGRGPNDSTVEVAVDADGKLQVGGITITDITLDNVEISNDVGNPVPVSGSTKPAGLTAKGYQQITSLSAAAALTVPTGATVALITAETQGIRWRDDGTNPTASVGMLIAAGESVFFTGSLAAFRAIEVTASAKLNISYYG